MRRPIGFLAILALLAGASGCATTAMRDDGKPIFGAKAWDTPPAPPQQTVRLTADTNSLPTDHPSLRQRLAGSIASFTKQPNEPPPALGRSTSPSPQPPAVASASERPTWFGLRSRKPAAPTTYMTDSRDQLNRPAPVPTTLPVALQVPTAASTSDEMVKPTSGTEKAASQVTQGVVIGAGTAAVPDLGGKPSAPGEDEVNPLPPAAEPGTAAALLNRMAKESAEPGKAQAAEADESTILVAKVDDDPKAQAEPAASTPPAPSATPPTAQGTEVPQAQAQAMVPTVSRQTVLASPQSPPPAPTSQTKPSPAVKPTPQGAATETQWRRPCLRRLVRRVCHLGEFADPPTAAPH